MLFRDVIKFETKKDEIKDITSQVRDIVEKSQIKNGLCHIYFMGTTGAVLINENERMAIEDFKKLLDEMVPKDKMYMHPSNSYSHLRSNLMANEKTVPIADNKLLIGTWQSIMFAEFDTTGRSREIVVTVSGD